MPKKFVDTSPRRWGTRFDSLVPASPSIPQTELSSPSTATPQLAHQSVRPIASGRGDLPKLPHQASVFVGSLPSAVDHRELIRTLHDHLSPYAEIHNIKVVRDSYHGGVCAFVQCQSAESAAQLIATLHAKPPPPFFGRTLRYERARSSRALLLSYRAPTVFTPTDSPSEDASGTGCLKPIEPATAMRLYKTQGARFFSVKYNEGAQDHLSGNGTVEDGLLLSPLTFDLDALHNIVAFFGPVDEIKPFTLDDTAHNLHLAPKLPGMDPGVWEVSFNHRDDAVNAFMTLRTVPHLTVTWAHKSNPKDQERSSDQNTPVIPSIEGRNGQAPITALPRAQSDVALSSHSSKPDNKDTDLAAVNSDAPTRRASLSEDGFPPLVGKPVSWADDETLPPSDSSRTLKTTSEYGSIPPTPGFTSGSISPTTPLTFSSTPTTPHSAQFSGGFTGGTGSLQYDYTSLFVGGLPPLWEEEDVRNVFGRFPGLEEVQLIRPTMKKGSSFAFVKFDNTESPWKAIEAENDHMYDGRRIRVQIRDLNPPGRFAWKRGVQRHLAGTDNRESFPMSDLGYALHADPSSASVNPSHQNPTAHRDKPGPLETPASVMTTPQPSTPGQTSFVPYPYHSYYPATPWSYPHYPYPMHYYHGYPTYGHVQPYPLPTAAVYNPYTVVPPPAPTDPPATLTQPPGPPTPIKPVYNATEHNGYYSDFQGDGSEVHNAVTPPPGHPPSIAQATPPPPASHPPPVASHPYPPYNPVQWTPAGPTTPHIHTPGTFMHFPTQTQMTPGRHGPTFPIVDSATHHQQRDSHRGRRNQRHHQRNPNLTDANTFALQNNHRQGLNHGFDHRGAAQPMPQWVNGGR